jgi:DMSO/TMAO reductase YedYZ heme-binding membrane subunit
MWMAGLLLGVAAFAIMAVLAFTSSDRAVRRLGPARWKRWHQAVYLLLPVVLVHATFLGTDFGVNKGHDVTAEVDAGCLVAMTLLSLAWLVFVLLRRKRFRWSPALFQKGKKGAL